MPDTPDDPAMPFSAMSDDTAAALTVAQHLRAERDGLEQQLITANALAQAALRAYRGLRARDAEAQRAGEGRDWIGNPDGTLAYWQAEAEDARAQLAALRAHITPEDGYVTVALPGGATGRVPLHVIASMTDRGQDEDLRVSFPGDDAHEPLTREFLDAIPAEPDEEDR